MSQTDPHFGKHIRVIIFDLDGTLIDTEPAAAQSIRESFLSWGIQVEPDDAAYITGRTWENAFQYLFKKYEIPVPAQQASRVMITRYRELIETELFPVQGSAETVRALAKEFPLALVSGSYRAEILWALGKLGVTELFQVILGAEDYPRSKPAPDGYLKAMDMLNVKPEHTLVFEDSEAGISSALAAGTFVAAITGTNHFRQKTTHAHVSLKDLEGIGPNWVRGLIAEPTK
jgi:HAD superfamily hydrolase (TIGR01509 family)